MFTLPVSDAIVKVAKDKKRKKRRPDRKLESDILKGVLFASAPQPIALLGSAIANRAATAKNKELYRKIIDEAKRKGIIVRKPVKKPLWKRLLSGKLSDASTITVPDLSDIYERNIREGRSDYNYGRDVELIRDPEVMTSGELSGKTTLWPPSNQDPAATAHEVGHTEQRPPSGFRQHLLTALGGAGALAGILGAAKAKTPEAAHRSALTGAGLAAIPSVAKLIREGGANIRGLRHLKRMGATRGQLLSAGLTRLLPSYLGQVAGQAVVPLATYFTAKALSPHKKDKKGKK